MMKPSLNETMKNFLQKPSGFIVIIALCIAAFFHLIPIIYSLDEWRRGADPVVKAIVLLIVAVLFLAVVISVIAGLFLKKKAR